MHCTPLTYLRLSLLSLVLVLAGLMAAATDFYVAPTGSTTGTGTLTNPWNLVTAMGHPTAVKPGDTLWLRGGRYPVTGTLTCRLTGTAALPIKVRQYPGERATLDTGASSSNAISLVGAYTWYWGFEVMSSASDRWGDDGLLRGKSFDTGGPSDGLKLINLVVHDTQSAVGMWVNALNMELSGCLIYFNGYDDSSRGHGHAVYTQNNTGTKILRDNILFGQYSYGIHAYTEGSTVIGYNIIGNTWFNNGLISTVSGKTDDCLVGPYTAADRIVLRENLGWGPSLSTRGVSLGRYGSQHGALTLQDNYFAAYTEIANPWASLTVTGNTFLGPLTGGGVPTNIRTAYPNNSYQPGTPTTPRVFVRPNAYEPGRAQITVYNWGNQATVSANVAGVLTAGDGYELRDAQNYYGAPVLSGVYQGGSLSIPMTARAAAQPIGTPARAYAHTLPVFGVFVLQRTTAAPSPVYQPDLQISSSSMREQIEQHMLAKLSRHAAPRQ